MSSLITPVKPNKRVEYIALGCAALLLGIWSLPESIALRNVTLVIGSSASILLLYQYKAEFFTFRAWPICVFFSFFLWLAIHLVFFSYEFNQQLSELQSLWLRCSLASLIGLATGFLLQKNFFNYENNLPRLPIRTSRNIDLILLYIGLGAYAFISVTFFIFQWWQTGQITQASPDMNNNLLYKLYKSKIPFVVGGAFFLPLCFILIVKTIDYSRNYFLIMLGLLGIACGFFVIFFSNTRNGVIVFIFTLAIFIFYFLFRFNWLLKNGRIAVIIIGIIFCISFFGIKKHLILNPSWKNLLVNIELGLDIDNEKFWMTREAYTSTPLNKNGVPVDDSTYDRVAWFMVGSQLLSENPLGFGLTKKSFGKLSQFKWPNFYKPGMEFRGATHSGWLDLALGIGIPGLLLIWIPLFVSWYRSLWLQGFWFSYTSWTIPIMGLAYLISEANGEHFIELLFYFIAFFSGITVHASSNTLEVP